MNSSEMIFSPISPIPVRKVCARQIVSETELAKQRSSVVINGSIDRSIWICKIPTALNGLAQGDQIKKKKKSEALLGDGFTNAKFGGNSFLARWLFTCAILPLF